MDLIDLVKKNNAQDVRQYIANIDQMDILLHKDEHQCSAMHYAAHNNNVLIMKMLTDCCIRIDQSQMPLLLNTDSDITPLHFAVNNKSFHAVKFLVRQVGAIDLQRKDIFDKTALDMAYDNIPILLVLLQAMHQQSLPINPHQVPPLVRHLLTSNNQDSRGYTQSDYQHLNIQQQGRSISASESLRDASAPYNLKAIDRSYPGNKLVSFAIPVALTLILILLIEKVNVFILYAVIWMLIFASLWLYVWYYKLPSMQVLSNTNASISFVISQLAVLFVQYVYIVSSIYAEVSLTYALWIVCVPSLLFALTSWSLYRTVITDPGRSQLPSNQGELNLIETADNEWNICTKCLAVKSDRMYHDNHSHRCVQRFDHWCPWTYNSIGLQNHRYFIYFLAGLVGGCITLLQLYSQFFRVYAGGVSRSFYAEFYFMILLAVMCGLLLIFQLYFIAINMTTLEYQLQVFRSNNNPHDAGVIGNLRLFFCSPLQSQQSASKQSYLPL
ncbi:hypothetical protein MIR68_010795 [Amoeboaphelidium protococcarum]|nr:hypothetical protein MIR68_010795 [Amoeboaphelidium protococcarum]